MFQGKLFKPWSYLILHVHTREWRRRICFFHRWLDTSSSHTQLCHVWPTHVCWVPELGLLQKKEEGGAVLVFWQGPLQCKARFPLSTQHLLERQREEWNHLSKVILCTHTHIHSIPASTIGAWPVNTSEYDMYICNARGVLGNSSTWRHGDETETFATYQEGRAYAPLTTEPEQLRRKRFGEKKMTTFWRFLK